MATQYGGDEVSALVLDPGSAWTRAGYAGEDTPKSIVPTTYGYLPPADDSSKSSYIIGDLELSFPRPSMEIKNPMSDGVIQDWDAETQIWEYALKKRLKAEPKEHPLLITEPAWNQPKNREKAMEVAFETLEVPAFYLAKGAVCAAFANGKATGLVVDVGAGQASVTPVYDGFVLKKGVVHNTYAGNAIDTHLQTQLTAQKIPLNPRYLISRRVAVEPGAQPTPTLRDTKATESYHAYAQSRVINEYKESVCATWEGPGPFDERASAGRPGRTFEFPDGYNNTFSGASRYAAPELLFTSPHSLTTLILQSINACDADLRPLLYSSILVTGSTTLLPGFADRLVSELQAAAPGAKVRVQAPGNSVERGCASWIGGSILASLGTFHQMWVSRQEYDEAGAERLGLVESRCT
ncbi:Actin-related protein 4 [Saitoella coloradoensis]